MNEKKKDEKLIKMEAHKRRKKDVSLHKKSISWRQ